MQYFFRNIEKCEMCGSTSHKLMGQRLNKSQGLHPKKKYGISTSIFKCKNCNLIFSNPQPIPNNLNDHYGTPPSSYWKESYFKIDPFYFTNQIEQFSKINKIKPGMKALDIGSGIGKCIIALNNAGFSVTGLEPSKPFYEKAIQEMGISKNQIQNSSIEDADFEENSFDFVTFGAVFEHIYEPAKTLEKVLKWTKPNGVIHIEVPSSKWLIAKIFNMYYRLRGTNYVSNLSPMHIPFHLYEFNVKSFQELSQKLNFSITSYKYSVCSIPFIPKPFHGLLKFYMKKTNTGLQLTLYLQKNGK